tara:strand:- start:70 stop:738 length:669 start_codon:yes stop_codon:yes gene_type:complete
MKKLIILMLMPIFAFSQEMPLFEEFTFNKPDLRVKQEVYLGDEMLVQAKGAYKPCIIPTVTKFVQKRTWSVEYRANEALCKSNERDRDYMPQYDNLRQSGSSFRYPIRMTGKGNNITLKYCAMGLCAAKQKFTSSEITVSDRFFSISPNTFQQSIEYAGKTGSKLNFTYTEFQKGYARDAFTRNFEIDLDEGDVAAFKGAIIKIHSATNVSIIYEVMRNFQS